MSGCQSPAPTLCGCCEGIAIETPEPIYNRPGLSAIAYRVGTHRTFLASLLASLSSSDAPALAGLRTRDPADFSIALLDAWATCLDILSFYQERIANESWLRTAVDAASVFWLAQLVGYQPSPGVAASTCLAFTLNNAPGAADNVLIPAGTRVQSVPAPGQSPQVFETSSDLTALIAQNAIPAQTTVPWGISYGDTSIWLQGTGNNINPGDGILFIIASGAADFHNVTAITTNATSGNTQITWDQPLRLPTEADNTARIYVFRKKASLFGVQAPDPRTLFNATGSNLGNVPGWPSGDNGDWIFEQIYASGQIQLDNSYPGAMPSTSGGPGWAVLVSPDYTALYQITAAADAGLTAFTLTGKTTRMTLSSGQVLRPPGTTITDAVLQDFVSQTRSTTVYITAAPLTPANPPWTISDPGDAYAMQPGLITPVEGFQLQLVTGGQFNLGQTVAVFGQRIRLQVSNATQAIGTSARFVPNGSNGSLNLASGQTFLVDAFPPAAISQSSNELWQVITTDGTAGSLTIDPGNVLLIPADPKNDPTVGESAIVGQVSVAGPIVTLTFASALARIYDRGSVSANANVVAATQGETMNEILGSGDATNPALDFTLKQSPLTYVSSPLNNGAVSTLQVWVNNLRWHEVNNFLDSGPADRVFVTSVDSKQNVTVQFGGGVEGSRTPTGQMNIRAVYRKGIGSAGNVGVGQLTQALDRPQGLSSVTNPDAAIGGADPAAGGDARVSAPLNVLTLGRVVSLEDYQNYALATAGISKALATWTWSGRARGVFLTVAGANGSVFQPGDQTLTNLKSSLWNAGNPHVPIQITSYIQVSFEIAANIQIDTTDYDPTLVLAQVWQLLAATFSFVQRQPGQGVAQSEIIGLIQRTPGVIAVELTAFNRKGQPPAAAPLPAVLCAASPVPGQTGTPRGAEMLLLDPASQGNLGLAS